MTLKWNGGGFGRPQPQQEVKMTSYLILKSCVAGGQARNAGDIVELSEQEGKSLTAMNRVQACEAREVTQTVDRSVALEDSDGPKLAKRGKKA
jgi:hypothetical protein